MSDLAGWRTVELKDVCTFENGDRGKNYPGRKAFTPTGIPFINAGHLSSDGIDHAGMNYISRDSYERLGNGKVRQGDILFCLRGSLGKFAIVEDIQEGAIASSLVIVRPKDELDVRFLASYFDSDLCRTMIDRYANGAAQPNLSGANLKKFEIPLPPLSEQRRIVSVLDAAFAGLATATAHTEKNFQNTCELFETHLNQLFSNAPAAWTEKSLGDVCDIARGGSPRPIKSYLTDDPNGINWIKIGDATASDKFITQTKQRIIKEGVKRSRMVYDGDFLLSNSMSFGRPYIMRTSGAIHDGWLLLRDEEGVFDQDYLYLFLSSRYAFDQLEALAAGSVVRNLNIDSVKSVRVQFPDREEQKKISDELHSVADKTKRMQRVVERKLAALSELKQSLLHRAFRGELSGGGSGGEVAEQLSEANA